MIQTGKGTLYVRWEPGEQPMDGPEDKAWVAVGEGYLEVGIEKEPIEGPSNGMWTEYAGAVTTEFSFTLSPPTGPVTVTMDADETTRDADRLRKAAMYIIFGGKRP